MSRTHESYLTYQRGGVLYRLPNPGAFSDARVQVAVALRNEATLKGVCPSCGARGPNREQRRQMARAKRGEVASMAIVHAAECPAGDKNLRQLIAETERAA